MYGLTVWDALCDPARYCARYVVSNDVLTLSAYHSFNITELLHKSHNALVPYPKMHHFVQKCALVCTFLLQNGALWDNCKLWDLLDGSIVKILALRLFPMQIAFLVWPEMATISVNNIFAIDQWK